MDEHCHAWSVDVRSHPPGGECFAVERAARRRGGVDSRLRFHLLRRAVADSTPFINARSATTAIWATSTAVTAGDSASVWALADPAHHAMNR
jgi:hypothetical protein